MAGESVAAIANLRGPVRRSRYGASDCRHESAACCRSAGVIVTCISRSASANVAGVTSGPDPVPVPNVGGAPGVTGVCEFVGGVLRQAAAATSTPSGARIRNWRRVFIMISLTKRLVWLWANHHYIELCSSRNITACHNPASSGASSEARTAGIGQIHT